MSSKVLKMITFCGFNLFMMIVALLSHSCFVITSAPVSGSFQNEFNITWSGNKVMIFNDGNMIQLVLDNVTRSGSGFASKHQYLFGRINMEIKLVPGDSAGTVTAYYLSSETDNRDEVDFEFLGNTSGDSYVLQTNVFAGGVGGREQRIRLWFDPSSDFHLYSVFWNKYLLLFLVDSIPIRVYENHLGIPFPSSQPMGIYSSIWNGDSWATRNGAQKLNWTHAPFIASYQNYYLDACQWTQPIPACGLSNATNWWDQTQYQALDSNQISSLEWVKKNYMEYDYCVDVSRYPSSPAECSDTS